MQDRIDIEPRSRGLGGATGVIHLSSRVPREKAYVGGLFIAGGIACLLLAAAIIRRGEAPDGFGGRAGRGGDGGRVRALADHWPPPGYKEGEWELSARCRSCSRAPGRVVVAAARAVFDRGPALAQPAQ